MESYMADYELGCMVYRNLRQGHLQEVGLMEIPGDHDFLNIFFQLDKLQGRFQNRFQD
jgi:hypothetical protein